MVTHPVRRGLISSAVTIAIVAVLILVPDAVKVYATGMMGTLRAPGQPAFIAGHRGDRAAAPENTMPAFRAAIADDLDFLETDVQLTADRQPVLMHDPTVDRTTNGHGRVSGFTLAGIRALDAGSWFSKRFRGTRVPTLDEFLDLVSSSHRKAIVELKDFWTVDDVQSILDDIYLRGVQNRIVFAAFDCTTLENLRTVMPAIGRIMIRRDLPADPVRLARHYGVTAILTTPWSIEHSPKAVAKMHAAGYGVLLYTLNSQKRWSEALATGVDGIVSDVPSRLDGWLARTAPGT